MKTTPRNPIRRTLSRRRITLASLVVLAVVFGSVSCRPELVVRLSTRIYHDGSLDRVIEIDGRTSDGAAPTSEDWLSEKAGLRLADPGAWARVEEKPGYVKAEGFFLSAEQLPPVLSFATGDTARPARIRTHLEIDDRVIARRWSYAETHGDPYSAADSAAALEALTALAVEALRSEIDAHFGGRVDSAPAEDFLWNRGRSLATALLTVSRNAPGWEQTENRRERWVQVLNQYGTSPVSPAEPDEKFWDLQFPMLLDWGRSEVAAALSTPEDSITPEDLSFWPLGEDYQDRIDEIVERVWESEDRLWELVEPHIVPLAGYYSGDTVPRFLFEVRVRFPGLLLKTNGTPDGDSVVWIFRERDLTFRDRGMRIESVQLKKEPLVALGARRELDRAHLVRLVDLLWERDPDGILAELLERAVEQGSLEPLLDENEVPEHLQAEAYELADLLDPETPLRDPL